MVTSVLCLAFQVGLSTRIVTSRSLQLGPSISGAVLASLLLGSVVTVAVVVWTVLRVDLDSRPHLAGWMAACRLLGSLNCLAASLG